MTPQEQYEVDLKRLEEIKPLLELKGYVYLKVVPNQGICGIKFCDYSTNLIVELPKINIKAIGFIQKIVY